MSTDKPKPSGSSAPTPVKADVTEAKAEEAEIHEVSQPKQAESKNINTTEAKFAGSYWTSRRQGVDTYAPEIVKAALVLAGGLEKEYTRDEVLAACERFLKAPANFGE